MEKRDKKIPYEVVIQERKRVDLYGNVVYYIHWFDKYGYNITNEWKFWSKGPKKKYDRVNRIAGVKDTYKRAFDEWKGNYKFFTELVIVLNHKIWQHYESNRKLAALYDRLWREADEYAMNNFKGEELDYYYRITD